MRDEVSQEVTNSFDPYLTYVTPVFNGERFLTEVIEEVAKQVSVSGRRFQHIIVDDGSDDGTPRLLERASSIIGHHVIVISQSNQGEATAVNRAISEVKTPFFCVVNADDPLLPRHGLVMTRAMLESEQVTVAYPDWVMIDERGETLRVVQTKDYDKRALISDFVCLPGPGAVIRVSALRGALRNPSYRYISDFEAWWRLSQVGPFVRVPEVLATWRQHAAGATSSGQGTVIADEVLHLAFVEAPTILSRDTYKKYRRGLEAHALYYASLHIAALAPFRARHLALRSLVLKPFPSWGYPTDHRHPIGLLLVFLGPIGQKLLDVYRRAVALLREDAGTTHAK